MLWGVFPTFALQAVGIPEKQKLPFTSLSPFYPVLQPPPITHQPQIVPRKTIVFYFIFFLQVSQALDILPLDIFYHYMFLNQCLALTFIQSYVSTALNACGLLFMHFSVITNSGCRTQFSSPKLVLFLHPSDSVSGSIALTLSRLRFQTDLGCSPSRVHF